MHNAVVGEDAVEVGEDIVGGESYELTTNPIRSPEEMESIERVSECWLFGCLHRAAALWPGACFDATLHRF